MSILAAVHLSELRFGEFSHLKDGFQSSLVWFDPRKSLNLQSVKSIIHNIIFSRYAQDPENVTSWPLVHINFQVSSELRDLDLIEMLTVSSQISTNFYL